MSLLPTPDAPIKPSELRLHLKSRILELNGYLRNSKYIDRVSVKNTLSQTKSLYTYIFGKILFDIPEDATVLSPKIIAPTELGEGEFYDH